MQLQWEAPQDDACLWSNDIDWSWKTGSQDLDLTRLFSARSIGTNDTEESAVEESDSETEKACLTLLSEPGDRNVFLQLIVLLALTVEE